MSDQAIFMGGKHHMNSFTNIFQIYQKLSYLVPHYMSRSADPPVIAQIHTLCWAPLWVFKGLHTYQYIGDTGCVQYATHAVIDELSLHRLLPDRSPAACILFGTESDSIHESTHALHLCQEIYDLEPGHSPWFSEEQHILELSDLLPDESHGVILLYHPNYNQCEIIGFEPLGGFARGVTNSTLNRALHHLILAIKWN